MKPGNKNNNKLFKCSKCSCTFVTSWSLHSHEKATHGNQPSIMGTNIPSFKGLNNQLIKCGNEQIILNPDIQITRSDGDDIQSHHSELLTQRSKTFPCKLCRKEFKDSSQLQLHFQKYHAEVTITKTNGATLPYSTYLKRLNNSIETLVSKYPKIEPKSDFEVIKSLVKQEQDINFPVLKTFATSQTTSTSATVMNFKATLKKPLNNSNEKVPGYNDEDPSSSEDEFEGEIFPEQEPLVQPIPAESLISFPCMICGQTFQTVKQLDIHTSQKHPILDNRPFKCSICPDNRAFVRKEHLTKHMNSVHSGLKFTCEFCGKDISRRDHLVRHIRSVHRCEIPNGLDLSNGSITLAANASVATNEVSDKALLSMLPKPRKPFTKCDMCDETFSQMDTLFRHQREAHGDIRKYTCEICPKSFKRREHLQKHIVLHTGEKKFGCEYCNKSFPRRDALQDHLRRLHGKINGNFDGEANEEFVCSLCDKSFSHQYNLLRHRNQVHNITVSIAIAPNFREQSRSTLMKASNHKPIPGLVPIQNFYKSSGLTIEKIE